MFCFIQISRISDLITKQQSIPFDEVDMVFVIADIVTTSVVSRTIYIADFELSVAALKFPGGPRVNNFFFFQFSERILQI